MSDADLLAARERLTSAAHGLAATGLALGTAGNLSCRAPGGILITPTGAVLGELEAPDIPLVDLDGRVLDGRLAPSSELALHLGAYARFGAGAVVHSHAPVATAVACVLDELPCVHYAMVDLGGAVPVAPYATFGTEELAELVHEAMEGHPAVLMANHGTLAVGPDLASAVRRTELLEWVATLYWRAASLGVPRLITAEQQRDVVAEMERRAYGALQPAGAQPRRSHSPAGSSSSMRSST